MIVAVAERATWMLMTREEIKRFRQKLEEGQVHISGDFRVFARNAPSLLKMAEATGLWGQLDQVLEELQDLRSN